MTRAAVALLAVAGALATGTGQGRAAPATAQAPQAPPPPLAWDAPKAIAVAATSANGESRALGDGLACDGATPTRDVHLALTSNLPAGKLSGLPSTLTANLGLAGNRLEPATSHVTLGDERGTVQLRLNGGSCPSNGNLSPAGPGQVTGNGTTTVVGTTGSYHDVALTGGTWSLTTATNPGADNPWSVDLGGQLAALTPGFTVENLGAYWANLGLDYVTRTVTVPFRVTNPGPGDSYGSAITFVGGGPGVTVLGPTTHLLGDLLAGESRVVTVRYQLALVGPPCQLLVLGCAFVTTLTASLPDALDVPTTKTVGLTVTAPNLPPPL